MSEKIRNIVVVCTAVCFLTGFFIGCLVKPQDEISLSERRQLAQFPQVGGKEIISGKFMKEFEKYASDQFPLREEFRQVYGAVSTELLRQSDMDGLYLMGDMAIAKEYPLREKSLQHGVEIFQNIYDRCLKEQGGEIYLSLIPDKNYFLREDQRVLSMDYDYFFESIKNALPQMTYLDITPYLELEDYYRTDPHWRQEKIVDVAQYLAEQMGTAVSGDYDVKEVDSLFYGSYVGRAARKMEGEKMYYLTNEKLENCQVYDHQNDREMEMYDQKKAKGRDPYEMYLSGSLSYVTIENPEVTEEKELIIFRDSFGSGIAPLLAEGYSKITLLDVRYISSYTLSSLVDFSDSDVLFLYSTSVLNHSETLK